MANNVIKRTWNQNRMVCIEDLSGMAFQSESGGHTFEISGTNDSGTAVSLSGTVEARFLRADNVKVTIAGTISSGKASVTLTSNCYTVAGRFSLTIFVTSNSQKVAVYSAVGNVALTDGVSSGTVPPLVTDSIQTGSMTASGDVTVNGVLDMTQRRCYTTLSSAGWYRVMNSNFLSENVSKFSVSAVIDINIGTEYWANSNETHKISLHGVFNNPAFVGEESKSNSMLVDKVRYAYDTSGNGHIDIHYIGTSENPVWCSFTVYTPYTYQRSFAVENLTSVAASPSGETVLTEYTFAANTEGTITTPSAGVSGSQIINSSSRRSGKVVSYHMSISSTSSSEISVSNGSVLATGLVPPDYMVVTIGHYWYDTQKLCLRCQVTTAGDLQVYWDSGVIPKSGQSVVFEITYIAA